MAANTNTIQGQDGAVYIGGAATATVNIDSWDLTFTADKDEITKFSDDWHEFQQQLNGATGTIRGSRDITGTGQNTIMVMFCSGASVATVAINLQEISGAVFSCSCLIDSVSTSPVTGSKEPFECAITVNTRPSYSGT